MNEENLFHQALAMPAGERAAFLDKACGGDLDMRRRVAILLQAHDNPGSFMKSPAAGPAAAVVAAVDDPHTERPGAVIGPYKLLEQIGEGGFGVVFMAEQQLPIRRKVALKVLKPGMDTKQVIARFEAERQALALMDHPNIAKVLDAGQTTTGRPYFVMDLVKGLPITDYCDRAQFTPKERLELFISVCQAVQHAHQKGIIHRDIKPSNVLVTQQDGAPLVKVIDFGIAKALGQRLTDKTVFTGFAQMIGSPLYMSPEQAALSDVDVDTRSDIYALGVLLYELLTGTTPFEKERLSKADYDEIRRIIREEEPPKPSTRISTLGQAVTTISTNRKIDPRQLSRLVRRELDWIVMKALEKDRNRRYETANGLARDVQRYLNNEAVHACAPSALYRFRKFARRHRVVLAASALLPLAVMMTVLGLVVHTILLSRERDEVVRQRNEAERQRKLARRAVDRMFTQVAEKWLAHKPSLEPLQRQLLEEALHFYQEFAKEQGTDPAVRLETGIAFRRLGDIEWALGQTHLAKNDFEQSLAILGQLGAEFPAEPSYQAVLAEAYYRYGNVLFLMGYAEDAEKASRCALAILEELTKRFPEVTEYKLDLCRSYAQLGDDLWGDHLAREEAYRQALLIFDKLPPSLADSPECRVLLGGILRGLGNQLHVKGQTRHAENLVRRAIALQEKLTTEFPGDPTQQNTLSWDLYNLARHLPHTRAKEAEQAFRRALAIAEKLVSESPAVPDYRWNVVEFSWDFGILLKNMGLRVEAEQVLRRGLAVFEKLAVDFPNLDNLNDPSDAVPCLAGLLDQAGRAEEADKIYRRLLHVYETRGSGSPHTAACEGQVKLYLRFASFLKNRGQPQGADEVYRQGIEFFQKVVSAKPTVIGYRDILGRLYVESGQWERAVMELTKATDLQPNHWESWYWRGRAYLSRNFWDKALADISKAIELNQRRESRWLLADAWHYQADIYVSQGRLDKGLTGLTTAIELTPYDCRHWHRRAQMYAQLQQWTKTIADCTRATEIQADVAEIWQTRGDAQLALGEWEKALADVNRALELDPNLASAWRNRGTIYIGLRQYDKALANYAKAAELNPKLAMYRHLQAWLLATCPDVKFQDAKAAVRLAKQAVRMSPEDTRYWRTLGVAYVRAENWKDAVAALNKAMQLGPEAEPVAGFFLAMAHWQLGEQEKARAWYDKAVQWMDKNQPAEEELRRFRGQATELLRITDAKR